MTSPPNGFSRSQALLARAGGLIAGSHHLSGRPLVDPERSPMYFDRGKGCRIWDVDGNEYVDFVMAFGAFLLGYANAEVDAAVMKQAARGNLLSLNHPLHLKFVEALLPRFRGAERAVFLKTGSEATTAALRIARRATGRRKVARCGYHGWHDWCLPEDEFVPAGLAPQVLEFVAKDPSTLSGLLEKHAGEIAAVIIAPEMVTPPQAETFVDLMAKTRAAGAVFIMDEVKTAFRTKPGSVQARFGIDPDMTTVSKALGNGWPVAAVLGKRAVMDSAKGMHLSATYHGETSAMAGAMTTLEIVDREGVADHVWKMGEKLIDGLNEAARRHGIKAEAYGEPFPPMPFLRLDVSDEQRAIFYTEMIARGILLHPRHMWFITASHGNAEIDRAIDAANEAFAVVAKTMC